MTTLQQSSLTGTTNMFFIKKREKTCFILFVSASILSVLAAVGVILLGTSGAYPAAIVCTALSAFAIYCIPIYYNNAARCRATARIYESILNGAGDFDTISIETGIEKQTAIKLLTRAINEKMITDTTIDGESIRIIKSE